MAAWKLTIRAGSEVSHEGFEDLDSAIAGLRARALEVRSQLGPAKPVAALRDFGPADQVQARLQLTGPGLLRRPVAGVDVRGDGAFVPFRGGVRREQLPERRGDPVRGRAQDSGPIAMSGGTQTDIPKGSYAAGRRLKLPAGAGPPFVVFVNGVEQEEGSDYDVRAGEIVFRRQIVKEKVGTGRWLAMYLGLFGTYRKNETVDLQFQRDGGTRLISDLRVEGD